jgi:hypothetical protein
MLPNPAVYRSEMLKNERHTDNADNTDPKIEQQRDQQAAQTDRNNHKNQQVLESSSDHKHVLKQEIVQDNFVVSANPSLINPVVRNAAELKIGDLSLEARDTVGRDTVGRDTVGRDTGATTIENKSAVEISLKQEMTIAVPPTEVKSATSSKVKSETGIPQVTVLKGGLDIKPKDLKQASDTKTSSSKKGVSRRGAELKPGVSERHMCQIQVLQSLVIYQNSCKVPQSINDKSEVSSTTVSLANIDFIASYTGIDDEKEVQRYLYILEGAKLVRPLPEGDLTSRHWQITEQGVKTLDDLAKLGVY